MALDSISSAKSMAYTDVAKQTAGREVKQAVQPKEVAADTVKKPVETATAKQNNAEPQGEEKVTGKMKDAIDKVNAKIVPSKTRCEFSYHEETKRVSIKVIDQTTEEVIREIPPEETLNMLSKMWELAGLLVDERR